MKRSVCFLSALWLLIVFVFSACTVKPGDISSALSEVPSSQAEVSSLPEESAVSMPDDDAPELTEREMLWLEDLEYFKKTYVEKHKDPFYYVSEEEVDWEFEQLAQKLSRLSDSDIYFELAKIVAGFKDLHTSISPTEIIYTTIFPIGVEYFGDKLYLCGYLEEFEELRPYLLHEIVSVNGVDIRYLRKKAESITDPVNAWRGKELFASTYFTPSFFEWVGLDSTNGYEFQFLDDEQQVVSVAMPTITQDAPLSGVRVRPENWEKLRVPNTESGVELVQGEGDAACVIISFGENLTGDKAFYQELFESAAALLAEHSTADVLIDLRDNGGGWFSSVNYVHLFEELLSQSHEPQIYVATNGMTLSASIDVLFYLKEHKNALHIGEPTGQFASYFMDAAGGRTLPNSKTPFRVSMGWWDAAAETPRLYDESGKLYEWENTILPDVYVSQNIEDVKAGRDSVIEWVLRHDGETQPQAEALSSQAKVFSPPEENPADSAESEMSEREEHWRADFAYFKRHYASYHPDPFYFVPEDEFDWQIGQLAKRVDRLSDMDIYFEFASIVAGFGDNHTRIYWPDDEDDQIFPITVCFFGDKLYLDAYLEEYEQFDPYLLHEIVAVNGVDVKYLQRKCESAFAPYNEWSGKEFFKNGSLCQQFMDWVGCENETGYTIQFLDDDQRVVSVELPVITYDRETMYWIVDGTWEWRPSNLEETGVEFFETEKGNYVYLALIGTMEHQGEDVMYHDLMRKAASLLAEHPGSKLMVDLRRCDGGWEEVVDAIKGDIPLLMESYKPQTYVLTGGASISAATTVLSIFKQEMDAVQVGGPTGQFTFMWAYKDLMTLITPFTMPFSHLEFTVATCRSSALDPDNDPDYSGKDLFREWEITVPPDVYVSQSIEDAIAGNDSLIEWALEH